MFFTKYTKNNLLSKNLQPTRPPRLPSGMSGAATYPPSTPKRSDVGRGNLKPIRNFTPLNRAKREFCRKRNHSAGFTIIELMVVVVIIGIVTGIVMASINSAKAKGRDSKRIADISVIQLALERYYDDPANKKYPTSLSSLVSIDSSMSITYISGNSYSYSGNSYLYKTLTGNNTAICSADCQSYHLGATLELANGILDDDTVDEDNNIGFTGTGLVYDVLPKF